MRLVDTAALTAAAMLLASFASAQGLGSAAAREREKRKTTPAKAAKVYKEGDLGSSVAPVTPDPSASDAVPADGTPAAEGQPAGEGQPAPAKPSAEAAAAKAETEQQAQAQEAWKRKLDQARKEEAVYKDVISKVQSELDDPTVGMYSPGRTAKMNFLDENKQKLAEVRGRIAGLEDEGRRNRYR